MKLKYEILRTTLFRKQYNLLEKRGYNMPLLDDVVRKIAKGEMLPPQYRDHPLHGDRRGYRDCHIKDDWVLIYKINKNVLTLVLAETGTHSDIFE